MIFMYKETYLKLLKPENLDNIRQILVKSDYPYFDSISCQQIELRQEKGFPYLFMLVDSYDQMGRNHYSMLDGIFVHIDEIVQEWRDYFYLPIVVLRHFKEEQVKKIYDFDHLLLHELDHLFTIVDYIGQNPEYINNAMNFNATVCKKDNIRKSMAFELKKLFHFEVKALESDFDHGERNLNIDEDGKICQIELKEKADFVKYNISFYVSGLFSLYMKRFPDRQEFVVNTYHEEVNKHGRQLFGKNATNKIALLQMKCVRSVRGDVRENMRFLSR